MRKKLLGAFLVFMSVLMIFGGVKVNASASGAINWYCIRNKNHKQPVLDSTLGVVEGRDAFGFDTSHGDNNSDKVVYLTFDAGYENGNVEKILDIMKEHNVTGAFFVLGNLIVRNTDLVCRMFDEGHLVCNHTYSHKCMAGLSSEEFEREIKRLESACLQYTSRELSKYYRPPEGRFDTESLEYAKSLGYKTVFWSIAYADWDNNCQMSESKAKEKIMSNIHNGAIILLHPTSATNVRILGDVIGELKGMGYRFGSLDEIGKSNETI